MTLFQCIVLSSWWSLSRLLSSLHFHPNLDVSNPITNRSKRKIILFERDSSLHKFCECNFTILQQLFLLHFCILNPKRKRASARAASGVVITNWQTPCERESR
jgi:hypothetical protein